MDKTATFIEQNLFRLRKGKILVAPSGNGDEAFLLAKNGFEVTAYDPKSDTVNSIKKRAEAENLKISAETKSLDMAILPIFAFDTIVLSGEKPSSRYFSEIIRSLVQGGTVIIEGYGVDEVVNSKTSLSPRSCYNPNELLLLLKGLRILYYSEEQVDGHDLVRCVAKKPTDKDAVKFGFAQAREDDNKKSAAQLAAEKLFKK